MFAGGSCAGNFAVLAGNPRRTCSVCFSCECRAGGGQGAQLEASAFPAGLPDRLPHSRHGGGQGRQGGPFVPHHGHGRTNELYGRIRNAPGAGLRPGSPDHDPANALQPGNQGWKAGGGQRREDPAQLCGTFGFDRQPDQGRGGFARELQGAYPGCLDRYAERVGCVGGLSPRGEKPEAQWPGHT